MRPIDADALLTKTINNPLHAPYIVEKDIKEMPTIRPEPERTMEEFMYGQDMGNPEDGSL